MSLTRTRGKLLISVTCVIILLLLVGCSNMGPRQKDLEYERVVAQCKLYKAVALCQYYGPNRVCECVQL
jgi:hypothetical protein